MDFIIAPDFAGLGDVTRPGRINTGQNAYSLAVFGILADGDVNSVFIEDRRSVDFAGTFGGRVSKLLPLGRIAIVLPDGLQETGVTFLDRFGVEGITEAIAAAEQNELAAIDDGKRGGTPLTVENARADVGIILSEQFASLRVQGDEAGRIRGGNVGVGPVLAVGGANVHDAIDDQHRAVGGVVRENAQVIHHVVTPDDVGVLRAGF